MNTNPPPAHLVDDLLRRSIEEDLGTAGDVTTNSIFDNDHRSTAHVVARSPGTIAGLEISLRVFDLVDGAVSITLDATDGDTVEAETALATLDGSTRAILTAERTCLNLLGHLSGIATATRGVVDAIADTSTRVADTRKTTPGLRALEKYAVRCGGGINHRFGLHDAVMIKDNHVEAAGSVGAALHAVHHHIGHAVAVVVEVDCLDQIEPAIAGGADVILFDNLRGEELRRGVELVDGKATTEASGGITPEDAVDIAACGVDVISLGWITHSAPRLDVALDLTH